MMSSLSAFGEFGWVLPILIIAILFVAVIIALFRKGHVKTAIWMRSSGFFLEANDNTPQVRPTGDKPRD